MNVNDVCYQYASALFSLCPLSRIEDYQKQLKEIDDALKKEPDFLSFLKSYNITFPEKEKVLTSLSKDKDIQAFLCLLAKRHRFGQFHLIRLAFDSFCNDAMKVKEGIVYSPIALSSKQIDALQKALGENLKSRVSLTNVVDARLIGGIKVAIDGKIFDNSLRGRLLDLRRQLRQQGGTSL